MFNNKNNPNQLGVFASGVALGGIIGVGVALLLAPRSGGEVRAMIGEKGSGLKDQITGKVNEVRGVAQQQMGSAKQQFESNRQSMANQAF